MTSQKLLDLQTMVKERHYKLSINTKNLSIKEKLMLEFEEEEKKREAKFNIEKKRQERKLKDGLRKCLSCGRWKSLNEYTRESWGMYNYNNELRLSDLEVCTVVNIYNRWIYYEPCKQCIKRSEENDLKKKKKKEQDALSLKKWEKIQAKFLTDWYIKKRLQQEMVPSIIIDQYPDLIKIKRLQIKTKQLLKTKKS